MSENPTLFPWQRIWDAASLNRLRSMGMIIDLTHENQTYAACSICLNRGHIITNGQSLRPCICHAFTTHQS